MDERLENYVLLTAVKKWKDFKADLKNNRFDETKTNEELIANGDKRFKEGEWKWLIDYWRSPEAQARSARDKLNRSKLRTPHTTGRKSFAHVRDESSKELGYMPPRHELFIKTHTRQTGVPLKQSEATIRELKEAIIKHPELKGKTVKKGDIYTHVCGLSQGGMFAVLV